MSPSEASMAKSSYVSIGQHSKVAVIEDIGQVVDDEIPEVNQGSAKVVKAEVVTVVTIVNAKAVRIAMQILHIQMQY